MWFRLDSGSYEAGLEPQAILVRECVTRINVDGRSPVRRVVSSDF